MKSQVRARYATQQDVKVVIYGDAQVGKTTLIRKWGSAACREVYQETLGVDFEFKVITNKFLNITLDLYIWDIDVKNGKDSKDKFESMLPRFFSDTKCVVLVFSLIHDASFLNVLHYLEEAKQYAPHAQYFLVGNQNDLKNRTVSLEDAQQFATQHQLNYIETSAATGMGLPLLEEAILMCYSRPLSFSTEMRRNGFWNKVVDSRPESTKLPMAKPTRFSISRTHLSQRENKAEEDLQRSSCASPRRGILRNSI